MLYIFYWSRYYLYDYQLSAHWSIHQFTTLLLVIVIVINYCGHGVGSNRNKRVTTTTHYVLSFRVYLLCPSDAHLLDTTMSFINWKRKNCMPFLMGGCWSGTYKYSIDIDYCSYICFCFVVVGTLFSSWTLLFWVPHIVITRWTTNCHLRIVSGWYGMRWWSWK